MMMVIESRLHISKFLFSPVVTGRYIRTGYYGRELPSESRRPPGDLVAILSIEYFTFR